MYSFGEFIPCSVVSAETIYESCTKHQKLSNILEYIVYQFVQTSSIEKPYRIRRDSQKIKSDSRLCFYPNATESFVFLDITKGGNKVFPPHSDEFFTQCLRSYIFGRLVWCPCTGDHTPQYLKDSD